MKKLSLEDQLFILAYAGLPATVEFFKKNADSFSKEVEEHVICIYHCANIIIRMKQQSEFLNDQVEKLFSTKQFIAFFNSLVISKEDDPRDIRLITNLIQEFLNCTDAEKERYADFEPFLSFEYDAWLQLITRIQKSNSVDYELKKVVDAFVKEGFELIMNPTLIEFSEPVKFFPWFEKLVYTEKEKLISDAMQEWKEIEEEEDSYCMSGEYGEEWYKTALGFAIKMTSRKYVSQIFAETFKVEYPELYEKFKKLADLDEYEIPIIPNEKQKKDKTAVWELFDLFKYRKDDLVVILNATDRDDNLCDDDICEIILLLLSNIDDMRYDHVKETTILLIEQYPECEIVKKLSSAFTKRLEENIDNGTLSYSDLPPSILYVTNPDLAWLF